MAFMRAAYSTACAFSVLQYYYLVEYTYLRESCSIPTIESGAQMIKKRRPGGGATTAKKKWQLELDDAEDEPAGPKGGAIVCAGAACKSAPQLFCLGRDACKLLFCCWRSGFPASLLHMRL